MDLVKERDDMIDYKVVMNVKHEGDATDLYSFQG